VERKPETLARHVLLLHVWLNDYDSEEDLPISERVKYFLELFSNILIPQRIDSYLIRTSKKLSDEVVGDKTTPYIDYTSLLKNKERDQLDEIFAEWRATKCIDLSVEWNERLRQQLKERYDVRKNLFDWDYQMNLRREHERASIINTIEYENWRDTGIAYQFWDEAREVPNRTLVSNAIGRLNNRSVQKKSYFGDMKVSPYFPFGVVTDEASLYDKRSDMYVNLSRDVAKHNVTSMMEAIRLKNQNFKVIPALVEDAPLFKQLCAKSTLKEKFDRVYIGNMSAHLIGKELNDIIRDNAIISVESARYIVTLTHEQKDEFKNKIVQLAKDAGNWYDNYAGQVVQETKFDPDTKRAYFPESYDFQYRKDQ
jgi:hypothetical protein